MSTLFTFKKKTSINCESSVPVCPMVCCERTGDALSNSVLNRKHGGPRRWVLNSRKLNGLLIFLLLSPFVFLSHLPAIRWNTHIFALIRVFFSHIYRISVCCSIKDSRQWNRTISIGSVVQIVFVWSDNLWSSNDNNNCFRCSFEYTCIDVSLLFTDKLANTVAISF